MKKIVPLLALFAVLLWGCGQDTVAQMDPPEPPQTVSTVPTSPTQPSQSVETVPVSTEPAVQVTLPQVVPQEYDWKDHGVKLTKVGTFARMEDLQIQSVPVIVTQEDGGFHYRLLSFMGEDLLGRTFRDYAYFSEGVAAVYSAVDSQIPPRCELVNVNTGELLLSDTAAEISPINHRFYQVIFAGEQIEQKEKAFLRYTDTHFSRKSGDPEVCFTGSARIFDLQTGSYVPNLELKEPARVVLCGDTLCVETDWFTYDLYLNDGRVMSNVEDLYLSDSLIFQCRDGWCRVYDCQMNLFAVYENASPIPQGALHSSRYLAFRDEQGFTGVMDIHANTVLPARYHSITEAVGDYFIILETLTQEGEPLRGVVYADGSIQVPFAYRYISVQESSPLLMLRLYDEFNRKSIFLPGFGVADVGDFYTSYDVFHKYLYQGDYYSIKILLYSTFDTVLIHNPYYIYDYLVYYRGNILETVYGQTLLTGDFRKVYCSDEYLYTQENGELTCYRIDIE